MNHEGMYVFLLVREGLVVLFNNLMNGKMRDMKKMRGLKKSCMVKLQRARRKRQRREGDCISPSLLL